MLALAVETKFEVAAPLDADTERAAQGSSPLRAREDNVVSSEESARRRMEENLRARVASANRQHAMSLSQGYTLGMQFPGSLQQD